jgi:hypothetical protein
MNPPPVPGGNPSLTLGSWGSRTRIDNNDGGGLSFSLQSCIPNLQYLKNRCLGFGNPDDYEETFFSGFAFFICWQLIDKPLSGGLFRRESFDQSRKFTDSCFQCDWLATKPVVERVPLSSFWCSHSAQRGRTGP